MNILSPVWLFMMIPLLALAQAPGVQPTVAVVPRVSLEFQDTVRGPVGLPLPGELPLRVALEELCGRSLRLSDMEYRSFEVWQDLARTMFAANQSELTALGDPSVSDALFAALDHDEAVALFAYTSACFRSINPLLISGLPGDRVRFHSVIRGIVHALEFLPEFHGDVYRGVGQLPVAFLRRHRVGAPAVIYPAFTSASRVEHSGFADCIRYRIHSHHGRMVHAVSAHYTEQEVLFAPGTAFRVLSRVDLEPHGNCTNPMELVVEDVSPTEAAPPWLRGALINLPQRQHWFDPSVL